MICSGKSPSASRSPFDKGGRGFSLAMEHLPASDKDPIRVSLEMVDEADIYIGIYAWRYGHIPEGHDISITEMELNRADERGIPILVFTMHQDHPLTITMVEADKDAQAKLNTLKERACQGRGRLEFKSPVELRSHIIQSLSALLAEDEATHQEKRAPAFTRPTSFLRLPSRTSRIPTRCCRHARWLGGVPN